MYDKTVFLPKEERIRHWRLVFDEIFKAGLIRRSGEMANTVKMKCKCGHHYEQHDCGKCKLCWCTTYIDFRVSGPVAKLASAADLKSADSLNHEGSIPSGATINPWSGSRVYGPYSQEDGRKFVILYRGGCRHTTAYARYLMEVHLGRYLTDKEEVDHIDDDFTNDMLSNLQILTKQENIVKSKARLCSRGHLRTPDNLTRSGHCKVCNNERRKRLRKQK